MKFANMINEVVPEADGVVTNPIIKRALRESVISFCRATYCWRYRDTVTISAGEYEADLSLPEQNTLACAVVSYESDISCSKPNVLSGTTVAIEEPLGDDVTLKMVVAVQPDNAASEYPDWMDGLYRQAIIAHAKHSILMQRGGRLSPLDIQRAQILYSQFTDAVNAFRREQNPNYVRGNLTIRRRF